MLEATLPVSHFCASDGTRKEPDEDAKKAGEFEPRVARVVVAHNGHTLRVLGGRLECPRALPSLCLARDAFAVMRAAAAKPKAFTVPDQGVRPAQRLRELLLRHDGGQEPSIFRERLDFHRADIGNARAARLMAKTRSWSKGAGSPSTTCRAPARPIFL